MHLNHEVDDAEAPRRRPQGWRPEQGPVSRSPLA